MKRKGNIQMMSDAVEYIRDHRAVMIALAVIVMFVTTSLLILPARTLDRETAQQQGGIDVNAAEETALEAAGSDYQIKVAAGPEAQIPQDASLEVTELSEGTQEYDDSYGRVAGMEKEESGEEISFARFFDISIVCNGEEIEPAAPVSVEIQMKGDSAAEIDDQTKVAHLPDDSDTPEEIAADTDPSSDATAIAFTANSFSVYSVYNTYRINNYGETTGLDGKTYLIMQWDTVNDYGALMTTTAENSGLKATKAWLRNKSIVYSGNDTDPAAWTFEKVPAETAATAYPNAANADILYYVTTEVNGAKQYLSVTSSGVALTDTAVPLRVRTNVENQPEGTICLQHYMTNSNQEAGHGDRNLILRSNNKDFVKSSNLKDTGVFMTLFDVEQVDLVVGDTQHTADKVSASAIDSGDKVVIYRSVWNDMLNQYDLMAINGYGELVQVTDEGGTIGWYSAEDAAARDVYSVEWTFTAGQNSDGSPSGYYWLQNTSTGAYLSPRSLYDHEGNKMYDVILPGEDPDTGESIVAGESKSFNYSIQMPGRQDGKFESTIVAWSKTDGTEGLYITEEGNDELKLVKGLYGDADTFNFASVANKEELTTVPTLDSTSMGIRMNMFDYPGRKWMSEQIGSDEIKVINSKNGNHYVPGLVDRILDSNGIPKATLKNHQPLNEMFTADSSNQFWRGKANHLLLESAYSETGYFEYDSAQNYAYFNYDKNHTVEGGTIGDFTVYNQLGAPSYSKNHGNFMPYSRLLEETWGDARNTVDEFKNSLPADDPRWNDPVHKVETDYAANQGELNDNNQYVGKEYDYNSGLTLEADFVQPEGKKDRYGNDIIFEFSGDDDLWLFVDDVLVLDLGGIHSAVSGKVNFTTGEIIYRNVVPEKATSDWEITTTIKDCFAKAGVFPDGTEWTNLCTEETVAKYFDGDTLKSDFFGHTMKVFYMERGKSASNLHMRFNLSAVKNDAFLVAKKISGTDKQRYQDETFMFQAFRKKADGTCEPLTAANAKLARKTDGGAWTEVEEIEGKPETQAASRFKDSVNIDGVSYANVFTLGHNEGIYFDLPANEEYFVREIGVDSAMVEAVSANGSPLRLQTASGITGKGYAVQEATVADRRQVIFDNRMKTQALRITKKLELTQGQTPDADQTFQFKVAFGPDEDHLADYSVAPYYIVKRGEGGTETYYYRVDAKMVPLTLGSDDKYYYDDHGTPKLINAKNPADPVFDYSSQTGYIDYVPAGYTVIIKDLLPGMVFQVTETNIPQGYSLKSLGDEKNTSFKHLSADGKLPVVGELRNAEDAYVLAVNTYKEGTFRLQKVSTESDTTYLEGAEFELYGAAPEYKNGTFYFQKKTDLITPLKSDQNGYLQAQKIYDDEEDTVGHYYYGVDGEHLLDLKLASGTYYLKETKAPDGYVLQNPITAFQITDNGTLKILGLVEWDSANDKITYGSQENLKMTGDSTVNNVQLQTGMISNYPGAALPYAGGAGTHWMYLLGAVLLLGCGIALVARRRLMA